MMEKKIYNIVGKYLDTLRVSELSNVGFKFAGHI